VPPPLPLLTQLPPHASDPTAPRAPSGPSLERRGDDAHLHAAPNAELTEEASELNTLVEEEKARLKEKAGAKRGGGS